MEKIAVVTGSARGIGYATACKLCEAGYRTVFSDIQPEEDMASLVAFLTAKGWKADYIRCDISQADDRRRLIDTVAQRYGRLDVHVNNAGVAPNVRLDILETTEESFDRLIRINLKGTFFMCQIVANAMIAMQNNGVKDYQPRIINIASMSSYTSSTNRGEYCVSKAGVSMVTKLFADKLAEEGIGVFEVRPGIILTDMTKNVTAKYQKLIEEGVTPIKRFGRPEDVANCVLAAAGGLLDFATGQVLNADGGFHIRRL